MKIGQLINSLVVMAVAIAFGVISLIANPAETASLSQEWLFEGSATFDTQLAATDVMSVVRNERDSLLLLPGAEAELKWDEDTKHLDVLLTKGGVLFGTQANDFSVSVHTATLRVDSQESVAYVNRDENDDVSVYGISHPSLLTFTENGTVLNSLFVPNGKMIKVPESKVTSSLANLRLTKLSKEFKAADIDANTYSEDVKSGILAVNLRYTEQSLALNQEINENIQFGPVQSGVGGMIYDLYNDFRDLATILPTAKERLEENKKDNMLTYAMSNLLLADAAEGELWLAEWSQSSHDIDDLQSLYSDLFAVLPGNELYVVKSAVIELTFDQEATLSSLRRKFLEVESLVADGESINAQTTLQEYQSSMISALESDVFDDPEVLDALNREYILVELLLKENADFYDVQYIELLNAMEEKILSLAGGDTDLAEERQAFVLSKIQFLTKLFDFVMDRRVSTDDAIDLANELLFAAEGYMSLIPSTVAVREWYESELDKADLAIAFIDSPEFYSYSDFDEGLEAYSEKVADLDNLQDYIQELRNGDSEELEVTITLDEALEEVRQDFLYNATSYISAESQGDSGYRLFTIIGGEVDVYEFESSYDRESGLLYDLVIEEQIRFSTGILLEDLRDVIEQALIESPLEEVVEDELVAEDTSLTADLAIHQAEEAFEAAGLDTEEFEFKVLDLDANIFEFEGVITRYSLPVSGQYSLNDNKVSDVIWMLDEDEQSLPGMSLTTLESAIQAVYEALSA